MPGGACATGSRDDGTRSTGSERGCSGRAVQIVGEAGALTGVGAEKVFGAGACLLLRQRGEHDGRAVFVTLAAMLAVAGSFGCIRINRIGGCHGAVMR